MRINKEMLGKRILYKLHRLFIREGIIEEISPNGEYVKINSEWYSIFDIDVLDVLESKTKLVSPNEKYKIGKNKEKKTKLI
ncbi:MAG: hypothetical protein DRN68_09495 [Thaumarchaeota archaeon]|nr:MAG: hypothetical protein DRN68_09495 [Nitrososphaerota archaeon]